MLNTRVEVVPWIGVKLHIERLVGSEPIPYSRFDNSHFVICEESIADIQAILAGLNQATQTLRSMNLHGYCPRVHVTVGRELIWFEGDVAGLVLPYLYLWAEEAEAYAEAFAEMLETVLDAIAVRS